MDHTFISCILTVLQEPKLVAKFLIIGTNDAHYSVRMTYKIMHFNDHIKDILFRVVGWGYQLGVPVGWVECSGSGISSRIAIVKEYFG